MQTDRMEEWRRLTALYSEMGDLEIRELAGQINDLTETAQQILRDEMKKRGIGTESPFRGAPALRNDNASAGWEQKQDSNKESENHESQDESGDYTWKVALYRCDSLNEAAARSEMLRRAGLDSWIQRPDSRYPIPWSDELGTGEIQINVAADQLDAAREIISQAIPLDVLDQVKQQVAAPEYEAPACPRCGTTDPILESVEPSNNWLCESCGFEWSDPVIDCSEHLGSAPKPDLAG